ncbi:MAG: MbcA/ParS/Xre antitoxin family protein [Pseudomonas sp.]|uniref:antitoxin Xre/MbcA/ParS toxin-binding domain-containing protein n=1 Tax=Pseudomonas sp. TaxID=306 RepID=UPI00339A3FCC
MSINPGLLTLATERFFGDEDEARYWLQTPHRALGGLRPVDAELAAVIELIGQLQHWTSPRR